MIYVDCCLECDHLDHVNNMLHMEVHEHKPDTNITQADWSRTRMIKHARSKGWLIKKDGTTICPVCRKGLSDE